MNDNTHAEPNVVLSSAWQYQRASNCPGKLLIAAANEVQVNFSGANVKPVVESNVHSSANGKCKTSFVLTYTGNADGWKQLRAFQINFLNRDTRNPVSERLEYWTIFRIVLDLNSPEDVV